MEPRISGIAGAGRGVGVTHLALLAANYMQGVQGKRTAVLEWNAHRDFDRLGKMCTGQLKEADCYRIQQVDYYPRAEGGRLMECLAAGYQEILIDFGSLEKQVSIELTRCSDVWFIVSFSEWQMDAFRDFAKSKERAGTKSWRFLAAFGSEEARREWNKRQKPEVLRIPFSADAFTITRDLMEWMETTLTHSSFSGDVSQGSLPGWKKKSG